jgi:S-adenosylmethionine-diacylgycerolhomoserine-N-methlytransferase
MSDAALRMDRMYQWQTGIYNLTRKPYLLGRDRLIESLAPPVGGHVLEIGCGTGRNLIHAARRWPYARFFGFDVSPVMLTKARTAIASAGLGFQVETAQGDATCFPLDLFRVERFDRIFFSYTLSMIPAWQHALEHAVTRLAPGGSLLIADFGDQRDLASMFKWVLRHWLSLFHVEPRDHLEKVLNDLAERNGLQVDFVRLYGSYTFIAALRRPSR